MNLRIFTKVFLLVVGTQRFSTFMISPSQRPKGDQLIRKMTRMVDRIDKNQSDLHGYQVELSVCFGRQNNQALSLSLSLH